MRILMFSITPLFPKHDMGGGQKHLRNIALHLAEQGHDITLLCTRRADTSEPFHWHERALVLPILRFRQPFPAPYDTPAYNIAAIMQDVGEHMQRADRFYIHDGEFVFPYVYRDKPTVVGLRDNVYPETIQGAFHFEGHRLIVISEYARQFFLQTVGRFFPELPGRIQVIRNSIDWTRFQPTPPDRILALLPKVDPQRHAIVLHPHRPEDSKGIWQTIEVADRLVHEHHIVNLRVLVPRWLGVEFDPGVQDLYARVEREIAARRLTKYFVFHDWVPVELLPEYYSLGGVTLALGHFVESFGNAVYESLGCGTPSIVARISTHRELLPDYLIDKVDFGDHDTAARIAAEILRDERRTSPATLDYLHANFRLEDQLNAYAETILSAEAAPPMRYRFAPLDESTRFSLPVWCYRAGAKGIYHDYLVTYLQDAALENLLDAYPAGFTFGEAKMRGIARDQVVAWYREGYLVPQPTDR
ncbi:MAG: glycosyltransferase family 4 protein [Anaerolineae bacterium]|nr:glycosyltransferase family 4 protein [Anaerolineae bacterium]